MDTAFLFPNLVHLEVELSEFQRPVQVLGNPLHVPLSLKFLTVICNAPPSRPRVGLTSLWKNFLGWARRIGLCKVRRLYLRFVKPSDNEGVNELLKLQGAALEHLHVEAPPWPHMGQYITL
jgi:hypothetical protein